MKLPTVLMLSNTTAQRWFGDLMDIPNGKRESVTVIHVDRLQPKSSKVKRVRKYLATQDNVGGQRLKPRSIPQARS